MSICEFMEKNNIAIVAKADIGNKKFEIFKRDIDLESFDLFEQLILYSNVETLFASIEGQLIPRIWTQGNTQCVVSKLNCGQVVALFFNNSMDAKESYFHAKQLDISLKEVI